MRKIKYFNSENINYIVKNKFIIGSFFTILINGFSTKTLEMIRLSIKLKQVRIMRKLVRPEIKKLTSLNEIIERKKESHKIIWVCWFQGIENAPDIVKRCYESICNVKNKEVILITNENYLQYTDFPKHIIDKWESGVITPTHFSDLLRVELLSKHGGVWLDSTVFLSDNLLPSYLDNTSFFCFQVLKPGLDGHSIVCSSWAISSSKNNKILSITRDILYEYWLKNNKLSDYFLFHIVLSAVLIELDVMGVTTLKQCNSTPHTLQFEMFSKYSNLRWKEIISSGSVHKLTYKTNDRKIESDSFIGRLLKNEYDC